MCSGWGTDKFHKEEMPHNWIWTCDGSTNGLDSVWSKCHQARHKANIFVVVGLPEILPPVTFVLVRCYRHTFKSCCAVLLSGGSRIWVRARRSHKTQERIWRVMWSRSLRFARGSGGMLPQKFFKNEMLRCAFSALLGVFLSLNKDNNL